MWKKRKERLTMRSLIHQIKSKIATFLTAEHLDVATIGTKPSCSSLPFREVIVGLILALSASAVAGDRFVDVSQKCPRYFTFADGRTFLPIGCNICFDRLYGGENGSRAECEERFFARMRKFAANGGNYLRIWLGHPFFEVMPEKAGEYDASATETVLKTVKLAEELGIRLKFTLESFRRTQPKPKEKYPIFVRPAYLPYARDMAEFFRSEKCFDLYLGKARYLKSKGVGDSPAVVCWELWNEINACGWIDVYEDWSNRMLAALKEEFPRQMVVQNLGSFSDPHDFYEYDYLSRVKDNAFMQVHRYLDPGAALDVARAPMDVICADAVREMLDRRADIPAFVAETGAVLSRHAGPSALYAVDREGTLLHDEIFAPFFAGSAGCGHPWHWDHQYIDRHDLWWHFGRFAHAVKGLDPVAERFRPFHSETHRLRLYGLAGRKTTVVWCRDKASDWRSELENGVPAKEIVGEETPFESKIGFAVYLPWEDREVDLPAGRCVLPAFRRSCVIRFEDGRAANLGIQREI